MMTNMTDFLSDLHDTVLRKSVLGEFKQTTFVMGAIGRAGIVSYRYNKDGNIGDDPFEPDINLGGEISHHDSVVLSDGNSINYFGTAKISAMMGKIWVGSNTLYTEKAPSKRYPKKQDEVQTYLQMQDTVTIGKELEGKPIFYRILYCTTRIPPIVVLSTNYMKITDINTFFVKQDGDFYNSSLDSMINVETTKTVVESSINNIKPKSFDLTYKELKNIYSGDYYGIDNNHKYTRNSAGITEDYGEDDYKVFYERTDSSIQFKLDGWSQKYTDDKHIKVNVYRTYENIIDLDKGPGKPVPDPNYTLKRYEADSEDINTQFWYAIDHIKSIILQTLYHIEPQEVEKNLSLLPIDLYLGEGELDNSKNVVIPYHVEQNPNLIHITGAFPFGSVGEEPNYISIFAEVHKTAEHDNDPMWLVAHYQDPDTGKTYTYKILYDYNTIIYKDTIEESYTAFVKQDVHTIEYGNYKFRYQNIYNTDISGQKVSASKFIYESPEVEFIKETKDNKSKILEFTSAIYNRNDKEIFIRSEYGCVIPYILNEEV